MVPHGLKSKQIFPSLTCLDFGTWAPCTGMGVPT